MSIDGRNDEYTAWILRIEGILVRDHAVSSALAERMVREAEAKGCIDYSKVRRTHNFEQLAGLVLDYWDTHAVYY